MSYFKEQKIGNKVCTCEKKHTLLSLSARHTSWLVASIMVISFFVFISGYFMGKSEGAQEFSRVTLQESLADQMYCSVCALYDKQETSQAKVCVPEEQIDVVNSCEQKELLQDALNNSNTRHSLTFKAGEREVISDKSNIDLERIGKVAESKKYCAQLIGFGTKKAANQFIDRMSKQNVPVKLKTRKSKTSQGKNIAWYQVVTDTYNNRQQLETLVSRVKKSERLHDVRIVAA
ncbi:hypothetical protein KC460_01130 [Candidatus Dependentiae bacterium]|nr:hypothetical protein [Candidatus Dependentiae bacterium]